MSIKKAESPKGDFFQICGLDAVGGYILNPSVIVCEHYDYKYGNHNKHFFLRCVNHGKHFLAAEIKNNF
jgi:hypothetical protein